MLELVSKVIREIWVLLVRKAKQVLLVRREQPAKKERKDQKVKLEILVILARRVKLVLKVSKVIPETPALKETLECKD